MRMYCSTKCTVDSRTYAESLQDERSLDLDVTKINKVYNAFSLKTAADGLGGDNLYWVSYQRKGGHRCCVYGEEWIGPSNATEGCVPKQTSKFQALWNGKVQLPPLLWQPGSLMLLRLLLLMATSENGRSDTHMPRKTTYISLVASRRKND